MVLRITFPHATRFTYRKHLCILACDNNKKNLIVTNCLFCCCVKSFSPSLFSFLLNQNKTNSSKMHIFNVSVIYLDLDSHRAVSFEVHVQFWTQTQQLA